MSLGVALRAQEDGIPIRILSIDGVEPGEPTVASGRYPLKRPRAAAHCDTARSADRVVPLVYPINCGTTAYSQPVYPLGSSPIVISPSPTQSKDTPRPAT